MRGIARSSSSTIPCRLMSERTATVTTSAAAKPKATANGAACDPRVDRVRGGIANIVCSDMRPRVTRALFRAPVQHAQLVLTVVVRPQANATPAS